MSRSKEKFLQIQELLHDCSCYNNINSHFKNYETMKEKCCFCDKEIKGYGNNAQPVKEGSCCDDCNVSIVIPERLNYFYDLED